MHLFNRFIDKKQKKQKKQKKKQQCKYGQNCKFKQKCKYNHSDNINNHSDNIVSQLKNISLQEGNYNNTQQQQQIYYNSYYKNNIYYQNNTNYQSYNNIESNNQMMSDQQFQQYIQTNMQTNMHYKNQYDHQNNKYYKHHKNHKDHHNKHQKDQKQHFKYQKKHKKQEQFSSQQQKQYNQDKQQSSSDQSDKQVQTVQNQLLCSQNKNQIKSQNIQQPYNNNKKQNKNNNNFKHNKKYQKFKLGSIEINPQLYNQYQYILSYFFSLRYIELNKQHQILSYLCKKLQSTQKLPYLIQIVQHLQQQGYTNYFCHKKIIKTICKCQFNLQTIMIKLSKKQHILQKKHLKDQQYYNLFPNPINIQFLQTKQLLENQLIKNNNNNTNNINNFNHINNNTIYLIDGNNCMVTQKHLRSYFHHPTIQMKVQAQIRFRWLVALAITDIKRAVIFFDDKFSDQIYEKVIKNILNQNQHSYINKNTTVIYSSQNKQQADENIKKYLIKLKEQYKNQLNKNNIMLITADRVLTQQCYQIQPLRKSSGFYFLKFCKKIIKIKHNQKGLIRRILKFKN